MRISIKNGAIFVVLFLLIPFVFGQKAEEDWPLSTPKEQGLNPERVRQIVSKMESLAESYSLLIVKNGFLVSENYFHGAKADEPHHIRSATKTIMSVLTGIAIDKGFIPDTDQTLDAYFSFKGAETVTIQHLLDMRSGFKWSEHQGDMFAWQSSPDPSGYLLEKPLGHTPGQTFAYNSAGVHLLSHILLKSTGLQPEEFADRFLFEPLDISGTRWMKLRDGLVNGGYGLEIKPADLAKIGHLFLNEGKWKGRQVISQKWIDHSLQKNVNFDKSFGHFSDSGYGNLWWNAEAEDVIVYFALGYAGQYLAVIPQLDIVLVSTQQWGLSDDAMQREDYITQLIMMTAEAVIQ